MATALQDAADRLVPALGGASALGEFADAIADLAEHVRADRLDQACILADRAWASVGQLRLGSAAEADLDAIVLALREVLALPLPRET